MYHWLQTQVACKEWLNIKDNAFWWAAHSHPWLFWTSTGKVLLARGRTNLSSATLPGQNYLPTVTWLMWIILFDLLFSVMPVSGLSNIDCFLVFTGFDWKDIGTQPHTTATNAFNNRHKKICIWMLGIPDSPKAHGLLEIIWFVLACQQRKWTAKQVPVRRHSITSADVTRTLITPVLQRI